MKIVIMMPKNSEIPAGMEMWGLANQRTYHGNPFRYPGCHWRGQRGVSVQNPGGRFQLDSTYCADETEVQTTGSETWGAPGR